MSSLSETRLIINQQFLKTAWSGGAGTYAEQILLRVGDPRYLNCALGDCRTFILNRPSEWETALEHPAAPENPAAPARGINWPVNLDLVAAKARYFIRHPRKALRRQPPSSPPQAAPSLSADHFPWSTNQPCIFHELTAYEVHPLAGHATLRRNVRLSATFLDLQDYFHPEFFTPEEITKRRCNYAFYKQYGTILFAISEFTKNTMVELLDIEPERIVVTYLAADNVEASELDPAAEAAAQSRGRYLIYPAKPWLHKNHARLLEALSRAAYEARAGELHLLLTGGMSKSEEALLHDAAVEAGIADLVHFLGFQPRPVLQSLLRHAELMVFPSLFEGFGMPVLEAQAVGCPVACSNTTSLPEVAGDSALLFDPTDTEALAQIIADTAEGRIDRAGLITRGILNVARFTWDANARATVEGYRRMLSA